MRMLGLDLGTKTLGIAISDITNTIASNYGIIIHDGSNYQLLVDKLKSIILENDVNAIVLGLPKNMNNTSSKMSDIVIEFKVILEKEGFKVFLEDERLTSKISNDVLINASVSRNKRKKVIDKMAAVIILQSYLDKMNFRKEEENG